MKLSITFTRTLVGAIGNVISIFMFASPTPTVKQIYKAKAVEDYSPDPYLATAMNCMLWILYGLPFVHPNSLLLVSTDTIGLIIQFVFLAIFFLYANNQGRRKVVRWIVMEVVVMVIMAMITVLYFHTSKSRIFFIGIPCVIFCIAMYLSPFTIMFKVIETKSVKYMPRWFSIAMFANGVIWTIYGVLPLDLYILIPNAVGLVSGAAQLILYAYYSKNKSRQAEDDKPNQVQMSSVEQSTTVTITI